jgi:hypothetical protein
MCNRCGNPHISDPLELCMRCAIDLRREFYAGLEELNDYLASWAAFQDWEAEQALSRS